MQKSLPLRQLDDAVRHIAANIHDYAKSDTDFTRKRKLDAETLLKVTLNMQGNSLNAELYDAFPDIEARMTASAYEQAKAKLRPEAFEDLLRAYNASMKDPKTLDAAKSYRVYAIDGSKFSVPYDKNSIYAIQQPGKARLDGEPAKPYAMLNANCMFDLMNRTYQDCIVQTIPESDERDAAIEMLKRVDNSEPFMVIMDRGYASFNMFETCNRIPNCHYVIRTRLDCVKEIKALPDAEVDTDMVFTVTISKHMQQALQAAGHADVHYVKHAKRHYKDERSSNTAQRRWDFETTCRIHCRIVKFRINDDDSGKEQWEVLVTNLNRFEFPLSRMKEIYHMRWDIETSFRELKYALGAMHFHSKKPEFIRMELFAHLAMFNAVSRHIASLCVPSANHKDRYVVDFKMACKVIRRHYRIYYEAPPGDIYVDMLSYINPVRPGRKDARRMRNKPAVWFLYRVA